LKSKKDIFNNRPGGGFLMASKLINFKLLIWRHLGIGEEVKKSNGN